MSRKLTSNESRDEVFTPIRSHEQTGKAERLRDIWSEFKWLILFCAALLAALIWLVVSMFSQTPDMTLVVVSSQRVMTQQELDRLHLPLYQYATNVNLDGKAVVNIVAGYCDTDGSGADNPELAEAIAAFESFADSENYIILCDEASAEYVRAHGWDYPMSNYSSKFGSEMIGMNISDILCFETDTELYDVYDGWRLILRNFEGSASKGNNRLAGYLYMEEAMADINMEKYAYLASSEESDTEETD